MFPLVAAPLGRWVSASFAAYFFGAGFRGDMYVSERSSCSIASFG
jgi:hypothetical protein